MVFVIQLWFYFYFHRSGLSEGTLLFKISPHQNKRSQLLLPAYILIVRGVTWIEPEYH